MTIGPGHPEGYPRRPLRDLLTLEYGGSLPGGGRALGDVPVLGSNGVVGAHSEPMVNRPGIVVGRKGSIGKVTWVDRPFWPIDTTYFVAPKTEHSHRWLFYLLDTLGLDRLNSATGVPGLNRDDAYVLRVPVPSEHASVFIADSLDAVDDAIDATRRVIGQTRRLKTAALQDLLTRGLPGRHREFRKFRFLGHVPASWAIADFDEVSTVVRGSSPRPAGDPKYFNGSHIPWITVMEVTRDSTIYLTRTSTALTEAGMRRSRILEPGTLVLTNSGATLGVPKILAIRGCANDGIAAFLNLDARINPLFAFYYLQQLTPIFRDVIAPGLGQPNLNTDLIGQTMIPVPDEEEQALIARTVFAIDQRIDVEVARVVQLHQLKNALSQALLTGRLRVPVSEVSRV